ncbi:MAG: decaprenyl-phosphate phosphoribosyltransferase [Ignavibacteriaceae bacterium]
MVKTYFKLLRVPQWIKNSFVFVPLLFSQHLFHIAYLIPVLQAFIIFCIISSVIYIINDIIDIEADRAHPAKQFRPLPSGKISKQHASVLAFILFTAAAIPLSQFNTGFIIAVGAYFILNLLYSLVLKHIVLLDIFSIAAGFMLRIIGGALVIDVEISSWLILTTMFISLFLAVMKRRSELMLIMPDEAVKEGATRKVLAFYSINFADQMATVASAGVIICYALYTVSSRTISVFRTENLIYTTPFVVFGIFRYMYLVYMNQKGENTTEIMITDIPMIVTVILYIITAILIIYSVI